MRADELRVELALPDDADDAALAACEALLSEEERARAAALRSEAVRRRHVMGRALLRRALAQAAGVPPAALRFRAGAHGKPELAGPPESAGLRFNVSHTDGLVACALARDLEVGVDVEAGARLADPLALARRFFAAEEARAVAAAPAAEQRDRFLELWVLKEAVLKAQGVGLAGRLASVAFALESGRPRLACATGGEGEAGAWQLELRRPTARHLLAVAVRRGARPDLRLALRGP